MFAAWCNIAAAIAWDLGWRPVPQYNRDSMLPYGEREQLVDLVLHFAAGRELSTDAWRFHQRRIVANWERILKRMGIS